MYERKVDLPHEGSPRRRMVTVGDLSIGVSWESGHCGSEESAVFLSVVCIVRYVPYYWRLRQTFLR